MTVRPLVWIGIDVGKSSHHACAVDETGKVCWSQKVGNDQQAIEQLIDRARKTAEHVQWAIDLTSPMALMLITVLLDAAQSVADVPGRVVNTMIRTNGLRCGCRAAPGGSCRDGRRRIADGRAAVAFDAVCRRPPHRHSSDPARVLADVPLGTAAGVD